ncbi:hypothetical protein DCS_04806 [Drechmeria coniospora]|uniref:Uncharacterized protein n=1 Tax=Drechmeria coniospora TaxID=98403 RepID=A0A151GL07_DRECN|nr:hypothetical protein DCS_04806 [Drechmeria coniospora]KYK57793.1 hypothetical protein DCS_04806 [Drechmeria coniospora]
MTPTRAARRNVYVPWVSLRKWIDKQEAFERENNMPAPLSLFKLKVLSRFVDFGRKKQPEIGDDDHVASLTGGHGLEAGKQDPIFGSKKVDTTQQSSRTPPPLTQVHPLTRSLLSQKARRYAAKCALQYLIRAPIIVSSASFRPGGGEARPSPAPDDTWSESTEADGRDGKSIFQKVSGLSESLGFGSISYLIEPAIDDRFPNFYSGRPVFERPDPAPPNVGVVRCVLGKKKTKRQVATEVLQWLQDEEMKRMAN